MWLAMVARAARRRPTASTGWPSVDVPTLVIVGEQDTPFVGHVERMAETIPGARLAIIPDAGHSPSSRTPTRGGRRCAAFLEDVA